MAEKTNKPGLPGIPKMKMLMYPMHPLDRMEISFYTFSVNKRMSGMNLCGNCLLHRSFAPLQTMDKQQPFRKIRYISKEKNYNDIPCASQLFTSMMRRIQIFGRLGGSLFRNFEISREARTKTGREEGGTEVLVLPRDKNEEGIPGLLSQRNFNIDVIVLKEYHAGWVLVDVLEAKQVSVNIAGGSSGAVICWVISGQAPRTNIPSARKSSN